MMAMTVFANSGMTQAPPDFARLADKCDLDRAIGWGLAVRLCRRLTGGTARGMAASSLDIRGGTLVLTLQQPARPLYGASNGKDLKCLADWLGLNWRVETDAGVLIEA
jgi:exopolyphosphatase/guanosine-5'-triphosphate,3'-diphosphate pyrophosphatase